MSTLSALLPVAGCAVMMLVCARMMRHGHDQPNDAPDDQPLHPSQVAELRAEIEQLRAQLEGDEQRADRQAER